MRALLTLLRFIALYQEGKIEEISLCEVEKVKETA